MEASETVKRWTTHSKIIAFKSPKETPRTVSFCLLQDGSAVPQKQSGRQDLSWLVAEAFSFLSPPLCKDSDRNQR